MTLALRLPLHDEAPAALLAMPDQDLGAPFHDTTAPGTRTAPATRALRVAILVVPLCVTLTLGWAGLGWLALDGDLTASEATLVAVSVIAFYWVALSCGSAALGLFWRPRPQRDAGHRLSVAILLPMYGEPADSTIGNAVALLAGLADADRTGMASHGFSLHILSDTRDAAVAVIEEATAAAARHGHARLAIHYRRRLANTDYKSGNIRDWVTTQGHAHDAMLILDADSIMHPMTVLRMVDALAAEPGTGLIQTVPRVLPGHSLWQRMQCFAAEVYGMNLGRGFALWTGAEGNFMGHNAVLRTRAFAQCAGLPHLPGPAPRGGVILSHDFVEAALLRRGGWGVQMLPEATGSFEDSPATLVGHLRRDRRWCQGNMQHLRLLAMPGLHPVSRFHLLQGAMAYLASVWWLALLLLWALPGQGGALPVTFGPDFLGETRFMPALPALPPVTRAALALIVGLMLVGPKLLGILAHLRDHGLPARAAPGFAVSVLCEVVLSILVAPTLMVHQVRAVLRTLAGFDGGWMPHLTGRPTWRTLSRFHATETVLGLVLLVLAALGQLTPWLLPVAVCLTLAIPLSWLVQRDVGTTWLLRPLGGAS